MIGKMRTKSGRRAPVFFVCVGLAICCLAFGGGVKFARDVQQTASLRDNAGTPGNGDDDATDKCLLLVGLPSLRGGTVTEATLNLYCESFTGAGAINVDVHTTNSNTSWTTGTAVGTLDGYALSASLGTISVSGVGWYTLNITGDGTKGVVEAYAGGSKTTIVLVSQSHAVSPDVVDNGLTLGGEIDAGDDLFLFSGIGAANAPYIEIEYTGGGGGGRAAGRPSV